MCLSVSRVWNCSQKRDTFERHVRIVRFLFTTLFVGNWTVSASLRCPTRRHRYTLPPLPFSLSVCLSVCLSLPHFFFTFESSLAPVLLCLCAPFSICLSLPTELVPRGRRLGVKATKQTKQQQPVPAPLPSFIYSLSLSLSIELVSHGRVLDVKRTLPP